MQKKKVNHYCTRNKNIKEINEWQIILVRVGKKTVVW